MKRAAALCQRPGRLRLGGAEPARSGEAAGERGEVRGDEGETDGAGGGAMSSSVKPQAPTCAHLNFAASVNVGRLSHDEGGPITGYTADVRVSCAECGMAFRFIGLAAGNHYAEPRVSMDGTELRAPIEPASHDKFSPRAHYAIPPKATN